MVLVKDKRNNILDPLSAVSGIIERRHTLPILSNVLIERTTQALSFLATDIEIQITARSALMAGGDPRAVTVGARKLVDILRALPEDTEVTLQQQDKRLLVKAGRTGLRCKHCLPRISRAWQSPPAKPRASCSARKRCAGCLVSCNTQWRSRTSVTT